MSAIAGDTDIAAVAGLLADRRRARILLALGDGRALPASVLASEAGVAASTASAHLGKLVDGGLLAVEAHGRHRYYRLAGPGAGELIEALARLAPAEPVRSLRQGERAAELRWARTCYDHLAGRLGTALMAALLGRGVLAGGDGLFHPGGDGRDRLAAPGRGDIQYRLTAAGRAFLDDFGLVLSSGSRRSVVRYCVDWSEQRHHLGGALGAALLARLDELGWVRRARNSRAVHVTDAGAAGLGEQFGVDVGALSAPRA